MSLDWLKLVLSGIVNKGGMGLAKISIIWCN